MRIIVISNLYPTVESPVSGGFITARLAALRELGVAVDAYALHQTRRGLLRVAMEVRGVRERGLRLAPNEPFTDVAVPLGSREYLAAWRGAVPTTGVRRATASILAGKGLHSVDVVLGHGMYLLPAGEVARQVASALDIPFVLSLHGSDINLLMPSRAEFYSRTIADAAEVTFVSDALRHRARELGAPTIDAHVVPNGWDRRIFGGLSRDVARRKLSLDPDAPLVGFVGNLLPIKGADRLPRLFAMIADSVPETSFVVIGGGPLNAVLKEQCSRLTVRFTGRLPITSVSAYMAAMDTLVVPSRSEGWPTVIMEAFASDTPVVATRVGGIPEAVPYRQWLVDDSPDGIAEMARIVATLLGDPPGLSLKDVAAPYTWGAIAQVERTILESAVRKRT